MKSEELRRLVGLMGLVGLIWLVTGCSNEEEEPAMIQTEVPVGEVSSLATYFNEYVAETRAWTPPTGYGAYEGDAQSIGIAFTQDGKDPIKGTFYKSGDKWHLKYPSDKSEDAIDEGTYYLYGYVPNTSGVDLTVTDLDGNKTNYSKGAKVVLANVPTVMSKDLCVVIGAKHGFDQDHDGDYTDENDNKTYDEGVDTRTNRLQRGDFAYTAKRISKESGAGNYVFLLFDHLYAALRISMKVHEDYAKLRTIKLKSLQLSTQASGTTSYDHQNITIKLTANNTGANPITGDITYEPTGKTIGDEGLSFWSSSTGEELKTSYQAFSGHFMPIGISTLVLTSVYDVYDTQNNRIREGCKATNTIKLSDLWTGQTTTRCGNRYTVKMTVQPTYLYVLSEPDLDSPTVTIK